MYPLSESFNLASWTNQTSLNNKIGEELPGTLKENTNGYDPETQASNFPLGKRKFSNLTGSVIGNDIIQSFYRYPNGDFYVGDTKNGVPHGSGLMQVKNGFFHGEFKDGIRQGLGILRKKNGSMISAVFLNNEPQEGGCYMKMNLSNGNICELYDFEVIHRRGTEKKKFKVNGKISDLQGNLLEVFRMGPFSGPRTVSYPKGSTYSGNFENGLPNGYGVWKDGKGNSYLGYFKEGQIHGAGLLKNSQGKMYRGNFRNGQVEGYGEGQDGKGNTYFGNFKKGLPYCEGTWVNPEGKIFQGLLKMNSPNDASQENSEREKNIEEKSQLVALKTLNLSYEVILE